MMKQWWRYAAATQRIPGAGGGGGGTESLDFSQAANSQYIALLEDI